MFLEHDWDDPIDSGAPTIQVTKGRKRASSRGKLIESLKNGGQSRGQGINNLESLSARTQRQRQNSFDNLPRLSVRQRLLLVTGVTLVGAFILSAVVSLTLIDSAPSPEEVKAQPEFVAFQVNLGKPKGEGGLVADAELLNINEQALAKIDDQKYLGEDAEPVSDIIEHTQSKPVTLAPRKFLYAKDSQRSYGVGFSEAAERGKLAPFTFQNSKGEPLVLKEVDGYGRFISNTNELEWQGGFEINNSKRNVELGSAYLDYVRQAVGMDDSLVTFESQPDSMLNQLSKAKPQPSGMRGYSSR